MDFGDELRNLEMFSYGAQQTSSTGILDVVIAQRTANAIVAAINMLDGSGGSSRGGYLYFSPGRYLIGRPTTPIGDVTKRSSQEFGDIVVPPWVTLWFAPNAWIEPLSFFEGASDRVAEGFSAFERASVRIEVQGDIIAERRKIFAAPKAANRSLNQLGVGLILLTGNRIREVYPEWWRANAQGEQNVGVGPSNRAGIQAAIDAGYHRRVTAKRRSDGSYLPPSSVTRPIEFHRRPSIPIVMMGEYLVDGPIVLGVDQGTEISNDPRMQPPIAGFELLGERGIASPDGGRVHIVAADSLVWDDDGTFVSQRALMTIRGPLGFRLEGISLNAAFQRDHTLEISPIDADWSASTFDGCSVLGGRRVCVSIDVENHRRASRPGSRGPQSPMLDFFNLAFTRCRFETAGFLRTLNAMADGYLNDVRQNNLVLFELRLGNSQGLEIRCCWLRGPASPAIRAFSGRFGLNNCLMHMTRPPQVRDNGEGVPIRSSRVTMGVSVQTVEPIASTPGSDDPNWHRADYSHGADIYIEVESELPRGAGGPPLIPASCTIRELQSHSWQLIGTRPIPARRRDGAVPGAVVLINFRQVCEFDNVVVWERTENVYNSVGATEYDPPSIFWCTDGPGSLGTALVMIGGYFHGLAQIAAPRDQVIATWRIPGRSSVRIQRPDPIAQVVQVGSGATVGPILNLGSRVGAANGTTIALLRSAVTSLSTEFGGPGSMLLLGNVHQLTSSEVFR
jgi:hypothetical protein